MQRRLEFQRAAGQNWRMIFTYSPRALLFITLLAVTGSCHAQSLPTPRISRDAKGVVTLMGQPAGTMIRYTLDGSEPGPKSGPYLAPIELAVGGTVKARVFSEDRKQSGEMAETKFEALPGAPKLPTTLIPVTQDRDFPIYDWARRHAAVSKWMAERKSKLVFVGDSITQMFGGEPHDRTQPGREVWDKYYGPRNAGNLGFGYDYLENTLWRLQHGELGEGEVSVFVVHIGTNNMGRNNVDDIATGVTAICEELRRRKPTARILLMGIMPRGPKPDATRSKIASVNTKLAALDGTNGITFLDIGAKLVEADGSISREVMGDFLHPTAKGYQIWAEAIEPTLKQMLKE